MLIKPLLLFCVYPGLLWGVGFNRLRHSTGMNEIALA